jgi:hypothetical protein
MGINNQNVMPHSLPFCVSAEFQHSLEFHCRRSVSFVKKQFEDESCAGFDQQTTDVLDSNILASRGSDGLEEWWTDSPY